MKRVSAHVFATVLVTLALFGFANLAVYANFTPHPNPNNRGHHYGWSKHNHAPVPVPPPNPAPAPAPAPMPGTASTGTVGLVTAAHPAHPAQPATTSVGTGSQLTLPVSNLVPTPQAGDSKVRPGVPAGDDPWWWLVLLLPPALAVLWGSAFRRLVIGGSARGEPAAALT